MGVAAESWKRPFAFSQASRSAAAETRRMYGKSQRVSVTVRSNLPGRRLEPLREERHEERRRGDADRRQGDQDEDEEGQHPSRVDAFLPRPLALHLLRHRDERPREPPFADDRAEGVRDPERGVEGVRERRGPEKAGDRRVADDAGQARHGRPGRDPPRRPDHPVRVAQAGAIVVAALLSSRSFAVDRDAFRRPEVPYGWIRQQGHPRRAPRGRSRDAADDRRRPDRAAAGSRRPRRGTTAPPGRSRSGPSGTRSSRTTSWRGSASATSRRGGSSTSRAPSRRARGTTRRPARSATPPRSRRAT